MKLIQKTFYYLLLFFVINSNAQTLKKNDPILAPKNTFNFFVIGDWGRAGHFLQKETAVAMDNAAAKINPMFIISTGDNFYEYGVASVDDPQWWYSFENVYNQGHLLTEWFPVFGNHDYRGNTKAQIDYSKKSRRWKMPDYYYSFEKTIPSTNVKILFVFLDTNQFEKSYYKRPEAYPDLKGKNPEKQIKWIDSLLTHSKADWKFLIGHHHVYTGGERKDLVSETGEVLKPILEKHNVHSYICGHEHDLQHLKAEGKTEFFISGAGSELRETGSMKYTKFAKSVNGFMSFSVGEKETLVQVIDYKGNVIYKTSFEK
ncbi:MAG: tartrate-resistant acid phosphatase type 5 family protein [Melioribacteraceae bacterium]|nr:tartrate-resistant acid phosphatase type 5 family protein [Melioribacteraceae bacterium]